jgi:branched-chain amino acid transport system substrate-binding protein
MRPSLRRYLGIWIFVAASGCNVFDNPVGAEASSCTTNQQCSDMLTAPALCVHDGAPHCAALMSDDCRPIPVVYKNVANVDTPDTLPAIVGDYLQDNAIVIGSLFTVTGSQASANVPRAYAAIMAVNEINAAGGIPGTGSTRRPLVLLTCDAQVDPLRAARHLVLDLNVPAIVGANASQTAYDITKDVSAPNGTALFSPTAIASDVVGLDSHGLTRLMVATDVQRIPVMISEINRLEAQLKASRLKDQLKLAIYYRGDLTGKGTNVGLGQKLTFNGKSVTANVVDGTIRADMYDPEIATATPSWVDQATIRAYTTNSRFIPDIVVVAGASEANAGFIAPLDAQWDMDGTVTKGLPKPYYVLIDSNKNQTLLTKIGSNNDLRLRIRGSGVVPGFATDPDGSPGKLAYQSYQAFQYDYTQTFPNQLPTLSQGGGMGQTYDVIFSIAFSLAYGRAGPATGADVVAHLATLYTGGATNIQLGDSGFIARAFNELANQRAIAAIGTFGPLQWTGDGSKASGTVETWCVRTNDGSPAINVFASSGVTFDVNIQKFAGFDSYPGNLAANPPVPYTTPAACPPIDPMPN